MTAIALGHQNPPLGADDSAGSDLPRDDWSSKLLTFALSIYFVLYVIEGFVRWLLNMVGLDALIFLRDVVVLGAVLVIIARQILRGRLEPFPVLFAALLVLHGVIGAANLRDTAPVLAGAKPYLSLLIGALAAKHLFGGSRALMVLLFILWLVGAVSGGVEKYFVDWPWIGMTAEIAGTKVDVGRDWQLGDSDKRAGGLTRSSIHLAGFMSIVGIVLFFFARSAWIQLMVASLTTLTVFWTTQKGALIAVVAVLVAGLVPKRLKISSLKAILILLLVLMIGLPLILPNYLMPNGSEGIFSLQSFYDRAQRMWPDAWDWYSQRATPLFGVGLGGIGNAMRLYSPEAAFYAADLASYEPYLINFADNMFVYLFVQLGVMALVYLLIAVIGALRVSSDYDRTRAAALGVFAFCIGYGVAVSLIEDQIGCMFLGASAYFLWNDRSRQEAQHKEKKISKSASTSDIYKMAFVPRQRKRPIASSLGES